MPACAQCGKNLEKIWPGRRFCDHACRGAYKSATQLKEVACAHCGKPFLIQPNLLKSRPNPCCGYACSQAKRGRSMTAVKCAECGKEFQRKTSQVKRYPKSFCGHECKAKYQSEHKDEMGIGPRLQSIYPCRNCGKQVIRTPATVVGEVFCGHRCSGKFYSGPKSGRWKDGSAVTPYGSEFTKWLKYKVRKRDGFRCRICGGSHNKPHKLHIHHYDHDKKNNRDSNLITLCSSCHSRVHGKSIPCPCP